MIFDFTLEDDELAFVEAARSTLQAVTSATTHGLDDPARVDELRDATWRALVEQGWPQLALPEAAGGVDTGMTALTLLTEEAGRYLVPSPLVATLALAAPWLRAASADGDARSLAAAVAAGRAASAAWHEPGGSGLTRAPHASESADRPVTLDAQPGALIVIPSPQADGSARVQLLDHVTGSRLTPVVGYDTLRPLAVLDLDAADPLEVTLPPEAHAEAQQRSLTLLAADLLGIADRALRLAVEHASARTQFGRPIGAYQGVKHRLADAAVGLEKARSLVYASACALDEPTAEIDRERLARLAKAGASDAALTAGAASVQIHGALGVTAEHEASWWYRRARQAALVGGDHRHHYHHVGRAYRDAQEAS